MNKKNKILNFQKLHKMKPTDLQKNALQRILKIFKTMFQVEFGWGKLLVAIVIITLSLLGPIIQLTTKTIEETQIQKLNQLGQSITKKLLAAGHSLPVGMVLPTNDNSLHTWIDWLSNPANNIIANQLTQFGIKASFLTRLTISHLSFGPIFQIFSASILYAFGWGIFSGLKNKNTVDKNRILYMNYNQHSILLIKIFSEACMFLFIIISAEMLGVILVIFVGKGLISSMLITRLLVEVATIFIFYIFIQIGVRIIISQITSKNIKGIALSIWLLSTVFLYLVLSILLGIRHELTVVIIDHQYIFSFMPIANIVTLPLVLYGYLPLWSLAPFIIYMIIPICLTWKRLANTMKRYLCS